MQSWESKVRLLPGVRERSVRRVFEQTEQHSSQWAAIRSIAEELGCRPETTQDDSERPVTLSERWPRSAAADERELLLERQALLH